MSAGSARFSSSARDLKLPGELFSESRRMCNLSKQHPPEIRLASRFSSANCRRCPGISIWGSVTSDLPAEAIVHNQTANDLVGYAACWLQEPRDRC